MIIWNAYNKDDLGKTKVISRFCWLPRFTSDNQLVWLEKVLIHKRVEAVSNFPYFGYTCKSVVTHIKRLNVE